MASLSATFDLHLVNLSVQVLKQQLVLSGIARQAYTDQKNGLGIHLGIHEEISPIRVRNDTIQLDSVCEKNGDIAFGVCLRVVGEHGALRLVLVNVGLCKRVDAGIE